jgi:hypothetical protein
MTAGSLRAVENKLFFSAEVFPEEVYVRDFEIPVFPQKGFWSDSSPVYDACHGNGRAVVIFFLEWEFSVPPRLVVKHMHKDV